MSVREARRALRDAAKRYSAFRDDESACLLEREAMRFAGEKKHAWSRREKWKERRLSRMGDGINVCRIEGCKGPAEMRPILLFPAMDGGKEPIRFETALLDVCYQHSRTVGPDAFVGNPAVWATMIRVWTENGMRAPDPSMAEVEYEDLRVSRAS